MIPSSLHQFWVGPSLPDAYAKFAEGWRRFHPEWKYRLWGADDLPPLRNQDLYDRAEEICPEHVGQFRSDIVRYELLYRFGGVWVDVDFECLKPIDDLVRVDGLRAFVAWVNRDFVNNAIMGSTRQHRFVRSLIDGLPASVAAHPGKAPRVVSGPRYLTPMWKADGDDVKAFPAPLFYPYLWDELRRGSQKFRGSYAVHHWHNRRRERGRPL